MIESNQPLPEVNLEKGPFAFFTPDQLDGKYRSLNGFVLPIWSTEQFRPPTDKVTKLALHRGITSSPAVVDIESKDIEAVVREHSLPIKNAFPKVGFLLRIPIEQGTITFCEADRNN